MRPKSQQITNLKMLLFGVFLAFFVLFMLRSGVSSSQESSSPTSQPGILNPMKEARETNCSLACTKIPRSLTQALIHYTTSTITPQQTLEEISVSAKILEEKSPCNFLVFGLAMIALFFLEEDEAWIAQIKRRFPMLESHHVTYYSKVKEAANLMEVGKGPECTAVNDPRFSMCQLAMKAPGRMTAIYTAGMVARNRKDGETDVFVHDVDREKQVGKLRHFTIPSHRDDMDRPFCPE
ncbi:glucuronoxylan methyltransferase [Salix suchowensis]|nr:glucuronoxylan methyltransferase [Salix suchowensis]